MKLIRIDVYPPCKRRCYSYSRNGREYRPGTATDWCTCGMGGLTLVDIRKNKEKALWPEVREKSAIRAPSLGMMSDIFLLSHIPFVLSFLDHFLTFCQVHKLNLFISMRNYYIVCSAIMERWAKFYRKKKLGQISRININLKYSFHCQTFCESLRKIFKVWNFLTKWTSAKNMTDIGKFFNLRNFRMFFFVLLTICCEFLNH